MITLCITTHNRVDFTLESFRAVLHDALISEVVIVDDCSEIKVFAELQKRVTLLENEKVKLFRNEENLDCYANKKRSVLLAQNEWVIVFDSDNILNKGYLDALWQAGMTEAGTPSWDARTAYLPEFAKPHFDYREFSGETMTRENVRKFMRGSFDCLINTMNYFVNRAEFLRVWDGSIDPKNADSAFMNYNWLKAGNALHVVPGLQYEHRLHKDSHYKQAKNRNGELFDTLKKKMQHGDF